MAEMTEIALTPKEANNLTYCVLKLAWEWLNPPNEVIDNIVASLPTSPTPEEVCAAVAEYVRVESGGTLSDQQSDLKRQRAELVVREFMRRPRSLREDLGQDADWQPTRH